MPQTATNNCLENWLLQSLVAEVAVRFGENCASLFRLSPLPLTGSRCMTQLRIVQCCAEWQK
eukprot:1388112-Amphidinium_carterae.2